MHQAALRTLLEEVRGSQLSPDQAMDRLRHLPFEDVGFGKIDHHRPLRVGMPEVIYSAGKTPEQVAEIFARMAERGANVLATRADTARFEAVKARVLIVCAGMEGALPSVVAGLVSAPVICVPTSVGYGASFGGLAALLGMLNSCSPNTAVANIDTGFGAGYLASIINREWTSFPQAQEREWSRGQRENDWALLPLARMPCV